MVAPVGADIEHVVDIGRYPFSEPQSGHWHDVVEKVRAELATDGCSVVPGFVRPDLHETLRAEGAAIAPLAHYEMETVNVYNIDVDADLPADHPARIPMRRENAFTARDLIPRDTIIHRLYRDRSFRTFLAACFGLPEIHELGDPLAGLVLNVVAPGLGHPWHFDTNEFAVSLLTQAPEHGGVFEYCPDIRSASAENFADVRAVLEGRDDQRIRRLTLRPGDLQLFRGRYSLHRVTTVRGETQRHTAIFSYSERPGVVGNSVRTRQLFGRVLPEHRATAVRVDQLLD
ncbi:HalD/BesD family halogenase [Cryptosporangium minutisporangium]|uniref:Fe2OG dioxygenase domain-containing protein n=1 Tax=Cryptosporangium minutisporangium TaxID=113569 RepID=A0ABP6SSL1_9ACTN